VTAVRPYDWQIDMSLPYPDLGEAPVSMVSCGAYAWRVEAGPSIDRTL